MSLRCHAYPVDVIRSCEQVLLDAQSAPDELMRQAAHAVAVAAATMVVPGQEILLLVGAGGNGGDALYAGAELAAEHRVAAVLLGRDGRVHERALAAFRQAGGVVLDGLPANPSFDLAVDGILGIGGTGGLSPTLGAWFGLLRERRIPVLAVDVPSGVNADTGALPEHHVTADVSVTFGALRHAHAVSPACGEVLIAEIGTLSRDILAHTIDTDGTYVVALRAVPAGEWDWPEPLVTLPRYTNEESLEPGATDDKYSGGVVGVCAGSAIYPGAGVLTSLGGVRATSAMVRYVGTQQLEVVRAVPEVVISDTVADTGRVQAWVVGPGRGTDSLAHEELAELLQRPEPLLIDADALTLLARSPELRATLRAREGAVLLTPHEGEFRRLAEAVEEEIPDPTADRLGAVRALAAALQCGVLLKGRHSTVALPETWMGTWTLDTGSSWAATPGSGDVLAGLAGAWLARTGELLSILDALQVHSVAAWLAARTPDGPAPVSATQIAAALGRATARLGDVG